MPGRRGGRGAVVVFAVLLGLVGGVACGDDKAGDLSSDDGADGGDPVDRVMAAEIAAIRVGDDGRSLAVEAVGLPLVGATGDCSVDVVPTVEAEGDVLYLQVTMWYTQSDEALAACERVPRDLVIDVGAPVEGQRISTQMPPTLWIPGPDGEYQHCERPGCDPGTGLPPADVTCDDSTLADAARHNDAPHARFGASQCELPWAVIDVDVGAGACSAPGELDNPCAGQNVRRLYWKADGARWELVAESFGSGCGDVTETVPDFPVALCEDLPALP